MDDRGRSSPPDAVSGRTVSGPIRRSAGTRENWWRRRRRFAAGVMGMVAAAGIAGCASEDLSLARLVGLVAGEEYPLSKEGALELDRFRQVYLRHAARDDNTQFRHFREAYKRVRASYVHDVADAKLIDAAIKGVADKGAGDHSMAPGEVVESALYAMVASLDPHSSYLNADEYRESQIATKGEFGGLGVEITLENGVLKVVSPIEDTPAFRAGLKPGDLITHVDGEALKGRTLTYAVERLRGPAGSSVTLTLVRGDGPPFQVALARAVIKLRAVRWWIEGDVGYLRVARFTEKMDADVAEAMQNMKGALGPRLRGVVLDLRNNPGGLLDQSLALADAFLDRGQIVSVRGRAPESDRAYVAETGDLARERPVVVLINGGSASASEIVAGALQDHGRAVVMGIRSFGKGSVQTIMPLPLQGGLRLTTALYHTPSGRTIQATGVDPDIVLVGDSENAEADRGKREADLPGALPAPVGPVGGPSSRSIRESQCPAVGEKADRQLGCAVALLRAGSVQNFLAARAGAGAL